MAKVSTVTLNLGDVDKYYSSVRIADRFSFARVVKKKVFLSRDQITSIAGRSLLNQISEIWATYGAPLKESWRLVSQKLRKNGWQEFVKDQSIRIKANLVGEAAPNEMHQAWLGGVIMLSGAGEYYLLQQHPTTYTVRKKITGTKSMYEPVQITENVSLPLTLSLSYKSNLLADGASPTVWVGAIVRSHYQGRDIDTPIIFDLSLVSGWQVVTQTLTNVIGLVRGYDLFIYCADVAGELYLDNYYSEHSGQNWTRDPGFDKMEQGKSTKFFEVAKNWDIIIDSPLAFHGSGYLDEV